MTSDRKYFGWNQADAARYTEAFTGHLNEDEKAALRSRQAIAVDGTPAICKYESAPRAAAMMPHAKIVLILRVRCSLPARLLRWFRSHSARALLPCCVRAAIVSCSSCACAAPLLPPVCVVLLLRMRLPPSRCARLPRLSTIFHGRPRALLLRVRLPRADGALQLLTEQHTGALIMTITALARCRVKRVKPLLATRRVEPMAKPTGETHCWPSHAS